MANSTLFSFLSSRVFYRVFLLMAFCGIVFTARATDDLNGIWKGTLTQGTGGCYPKYFIELQINFANNVITGKAYDYYDTTRYVKLSFSGRYNPLNHRLVLTETKVLQYNIPSDCVPCIKTYDLIYSKKGKDEVLEGEWKGHIMDKMSSCPPGSISLTKAMSSDFATEINQPDSLRDLQEHLNLAPRTKELVKTILVDTSKIRIRLYDNAEIDGDTITVFINNKMLLYKKRLSDIPLELALDAVAGTDYELLMYADNLGSIPPNTALMVVTAGNKKYELFLSSTEQKTAAVRFRYVRADGKAK